MELRKAGTGGPAFPVRIDATEQYVGMSLRDYFAGQALQGMIASPNISIKKTPSMAQMAEDAYKMAGYMIREREREPAK